MPVFDEVKQELTQNKGNIRCQRVTALLKSLGFEVRDGSQGGHKVFTHDKLADFYSSSFNCGHGKNPEIKPAYIVKILKTINQYEEALRKLSE
ncbi:type II toxin-antitoxin system HicA family toxin [Cellvibrio sp. QJXJ]|uniref:type II toxin-antitoxin system HicA family toxin n=1 Tax=Cellvibrio sp. QJXJ TaxID=2964606 RepID=UPI0021C326A0|nr:type II toxin-antitoxin system HicA family toxin [Cellvibrio sp. QJXJ]UUA71559.1 type II toxin-antitoxin system HicA family toxin [Cellvibrio sp. QJXJ]